MGAPLVQATYATQAKINNNNNNSAFNGLVFVRQYNLVNKNLSGEPLNNSTQAQHHITAFNTALEQQRSPGEDEEMHRAAVVVRSTGYCS